MRNTAMFHQVLYITIKQAKRFRIVYYDLLISNLDSKKLNRQPNIK